MKRKPATYMDYPSYDAARGGCKVGWYTYAKREDAEVAAKAARHNAAIQAGLGFDFGYQSPGSITEIKTGPHAGKFEVVIP